MNKWIIRGQKLNLKEWGRRRTREKGGVGPSQYATSATCVHAGIYGRNNVIAKRVNFILALV